VLSYRIEFIPDRDAELFAAVPASAAVKRSLMRLDCPYPFDCVAFRQIARPQVGDLRVSVWFDVNVKRQILPWAAPSYH
jgi:hypothetical protein